MGKSGQCGDERATVLLVDDSAINTRMLAHALSEYNTLVASNGPDAINLALTHHPDIILLDVQMPGMDGFEVCRLLRRSPKTKDIPVIFLTGLMEPGSVARGFQAGAVDYITKPFEFAEVKARLATHLDLCRTRRALAVQNRLLENKLREQRLNIELARRILGLVNGVCPRYVDLADGLALFCLPIAVPCRVEGGDHYFVRTLHSQEASAQTVVSVKDQSGHAVNCILRSIATDLFHNAILSHRPSIPMEDVLARLNSALCGSGFFKGDDFCTGVTAVIDHRDLTLRYSSAGHPPIFLIREEEVRPLPTGPSEGNLPFAVHADLPFRSGSARLVPGDRLLFYTDGVLDLAGEHRGAPFRHPDLARLLAECLEKGHRRASDLVAALLASLTPYPPADPAFKEALPDDFTLLAIEVEAIQGEERQAFVPAAFSSIDALIEAVLDFIGIADEQFAMAVHEAVLNAWRHGNRQQADLPVEIAVWRGNDDNVAVRDQGSGFDSSEIVDPTSELARVRECGRGIFIMRKFAAAVRWRKQGREVILSRNRGVLPVAPWSSSFSLWR